MNRFDCNEGSLALMSSTRVDNSYFAFEDSFKMMEKLLNVHQQQRGLLCSLSFYSLVRCDSK